MPGIVGIITRKSRPASEAQLQSMVQSISHESFYESGTWNDEPAGVYVGWTALKNSFSSGMPLRNEREDIFLFFSGEEYSNPRTGGQPRRHDCGSASAESEYLVHLYEEDANFIQHLNGMFHGLIVDQARHLVTLFNDRYGMHRLYYHQSNDGFYFATEAKAILAVRPELRASDLRGLGEFVACSCVLENRTIFKGIHLLPAASSWTFRNADLSCQEYVLRSAAVGEPDSTGGGPLL